MQKGLKRINIFANLSNFLSLELWRLVFWLSCFYVFISNVLIFRQIGDFVIYVVKLQLVEIDKVRNGNREALTALRKRARTTKTSVPSPFESMMKEIGGSELRPFVKEVCTTCGSHDSSERTWMMFPGADVFARVPFHAAHSILETGISLATYYSAVIWYKCN